MILLPPGLISSHRRPGPHCPRWASCHPPYLSHKVALSSNHSDDPKTLLKGKECVYKCQMVLV